MNEDTHTVGGREVVAYLELTEPNSHRIQTVYPIPRDGSQGLAFTEKVNGSAAVWGIDSERGKRYREAYESGELPSGDVEELNRIMGGEVRDE